MLPMDLKYMIESHAFHNEGQNTVALFLLLFISVACALLMVLCLSRQKTSKNSHVFNSKNTDTFLLNKQPSSVRTCAKRLHYWICSNLVQKLSNDVKPQPVCYNDTIIINDSATQTPSENNFYIMWSTDLIQRNNKFVEMNDLIRNHRASHVSRRRSNALQLPKQLHYKSRRNYLLVRKYQHYLKRMRKFTNTDREQVIVLNDKNDLKDSQNPYVIQNATDETAYVDESPWVKSAQTADEKSRASCQTHSSLSSFRMKFAPQISSRAHDPNDIIADLYVFPGNVILGCLILEGTFGRLYEAKLHIPADRKRLQQDRWIKVFVKTVTEHARSEQIQVLLKDAAKFAGLRHKRLTNIFASTRKQLTEATKSECITSVPLLIYPHAKFGILKQFLRETIIGHLDKQSVLQPLTIEQVATMGLQIVNAVSYLHGVNIIHGDVATRNCFLDFGFRISLGDSALSRDFFPEDYHCLGDNSNRPIKWLSLEALVERTYSVAADVWSIGVTLWELITKGQQPYELLDPFEMAGVLCAGYRLRQPPNCPDQLWNIIEACWKMPPSSRPSTTELTRNLEQFKETVTNYI